MSVYSIIGQASLICGVFIVTGLVGCGNQEKLDVYSCANKNDANSCSNGCVMHKDMKYSFLANKDEKSVLQVIYYKGEMKGSITHKNCIIFSNRNWDCSKDETFRYVYSHDYTKMTDGVFSSYTEVREIDSFKSRNPDEKGACAK